MAFSAGTALTTGTRTSSGTSITATIGATGASVGDLLIVSVAMDNVATSDGESNNFTGCSDNASGTTNVYTKAKEWTNTAGSSSDGATIAVYYCKLTTALVNTNVVTVTNTSSGDATMSVWKFPASLGSIALETVTTPVVVDGTAHGTSISYSGLSNIERLYIRHTGVEDESFSARTVTGSHTLMTQVVSTTSGLPANNIIQDGEYRILTGTGDTSNPTFTTSASTQSATIFLAFREIQGAPAGRADETDTSYVAYSPPATPHWNPNDQSGNVVLSNNFRKAAAPVTGLSDLGVRGTLSRSSGKYAIEYVVNVINPMVLGIANASWSLGSSYLGSNANGCGYYNDGSIFRGGSTVATYASYTTNDKITVYIDCTARLIWFAKNGVVQAGDPGAGTGGIDISTLGTAFYPCFSLSSDTGLGAFTTAFTGAYLSYDLPSGFTAWDGTLRPLSVETDTAYALGRAVGHGYSSETDTAYARGLGGGFLSGSTTESSANFTISALGYEDWIHFIDTSSTTVKSGGGATITFGPKTHSYSDDARTITWTGGTPVASGSDNNGVYNLASEGSNNYTFTFPAGISPRRAVIYAHVHADNLGTCSISSDISLSDSSAEPINVTGITSTDPVTKPGYITIDYSARSDSQTLTVVLHCSDSYATNDVAVMGAGWYYSGHPVGRAIETDTAYALSTGAQGGSVGRADETDIAYARGSARPADISNETDTSYALIVTIVKPIGRADETDTAYSRGSARPADRSNETDTSYSLGSARPAVRSDETDTAYSRGSARPADRSNETDTAYALIPKQIKSVGQSNETDISYALGSSRPADRSNETDTAYALSASQPVGRANETDTSYALGSARPADRSNETDTSYALTVTIVKPIGQSNETDTAYALIPKQIKSVGQSNETDTSYALGSSRPADRSNESDTSYPLGSARPAVRSDETDTAYALIPKQIAATGLSIETDTSYALSSPAGAVVGRADETDTSYPLGSARPADRANESDTSYSLGSARPAVRSDETDTAYTLVPKQIKSVGQSNETDTAYALIPKQIAATGLSIETDTSYALSSPAGAVVGRADETDTSYPLGSARPADRANESDTSYSLGSARPADRANETDIAYALQSVGGGVAGLSIESDTAFALGNVSILNVGRSDEADTSYALRLANPKPTGLSTETNTSFALTIKQIIATGRSNETDTSYSLTSKQITATGLSSETDTAFVLSAARPVGRSDETDYSYQLGNVSKRTVGLSTESDTAYSLILINVGSVGRSNETDTAFSLSGVIGTDYGAAVGSIDLTGTATGKVKIKGSATGTIAITGVATAHNVASGAATGSIAFTGQSAASVKAKGVAASSIDLTGTATGTAKIKGTATGTINFTGSGRIHFVLTSEGEAQGSLDLSGIATGQVIVEGFSDNVVSLFGSSTGKAEVKAICEGSIDFNGESEAYIHRQRNTVARFEYSDWDRPGQKNYSRGQGVIKTRPTQQNNIGLQPNTSRRNTRNRS